MQLRRKRADGLDHQVRKYVKLEEAHVKNELHEEKKESINEPKKWMQVWDGIQLMRSNKTAPVDVDGCEVCMHIYIHEI